MVFTFDRQTECYYSPDRDEYFGNRHGRSSHVDKALKRLDNGMTV